MTSDPAASWSSRGTRIAREASLIEAVERLGGVWLRHRERDANDAGRCFAAVGKRSGSWRSSAYRSTGGGGAGRGGRHGCGDDITEAAEEVGGAEAKSILFCSEGRSCSATSPAGASGSDVPPASFRWTRLVASVS